MECDDVVMRSRIITMTLIRAGNLDQQIFFLKSREHFFDLWSISTSKKRKVEDIIDVKSAAKCKLEHDYAALFDVDDDEPALATEEDA